MATDNLGLFGIPEENLQKRNNPRRKRKKPFVIESRLPNSIVIGDWWTHGRYDTESRRDEAYAVLVKKVDNSSYPWNKMEYRKI